MSPFLQRREWIFRVGDERGSSYNVALGYAALHGETNNSTAVGSNALAVNVSGNQNTAIGSAALSGNTTGGNNTTVGLRPAGPTSRDEQYTHRVPGGCASGDLTNATAIGARAKVASNNTVVLGNAAVTDVLAGTNSQAVVHSAAFMAASAALPPADRLCGQFRYLAGAAGVKDQVVVCAKDANDAWAWRVIY